MRIRSWQASSAGSICRQTTPPSSWRDSPRTRSSSACAISCRPSPTIASCCGRLSAAASLCSKSRDLTYDILIYPRHLPAAAELVSRFTRQRFVLDHLAKPDIRTRRDAGMGKGDPRAREIPTGVLQAVGARHRGGLDATGRRTTFGRISTSHSIVSAPHRLLVGSDWPVCTVAADYARTISLIDDYMAARPVCGARRRDGWERGALVASARPSSATRGALSVPKGAGELV